MGHEWDGRAKWQKQGRTGPNGPRYAKASDRRKVQREGGKGCAVVALALIALPVGGVVEIVRAVL